MPAIFFRRAGDATKRRTEIRKIDESKQQAGHPEDVLMREERKQSQHGNYFKLQLLRLMRHPLW
jgi:hypothetical protein